MQLAKTLDIPLDRIDTGYEPLNRWKSIIWQNQTLFFALQSTTSIFMVSETYQYAWHVVNDLKIIDFAVCVKESIEIILQTQNMILLARFDPKEPYREFHIGPNDNIAIKDQLFKTIPESYKHVFLTSWPRCAFISKNGLEIWTYGVNYSLRLFQHRKGVKFRDLWVFNSGRVLTYDGDISLYEPGKDLPSISYTSPGMITCCTELTDGKIIYATQDGSLYDLQGNLIDLLGLRHTQITVLKPLDNAWCLAIPTSGKFLLFHSNHNNTYTVQETKCKDIPELISGYHIKNEWHVRCSKQINILQALPERVSIFNIDIDQEVYSASYSNKYLLKSTTTNDITIQLFQ